MCIRDRNITPHALGIEYRPAGVMRFIVRNFFALFVGMPLFLAGMVLFCVPYFIPRIAVKMFPVDDDSRYPRPVPKACKLDSSRAPAPSLNQPAIRIASGSPTGRSQRVSRLTSSMTNEVCSVEPSVQLKFRRTVCPL